MNCMRIIMTSNKFDHFIQFLLFSFASEFNVKHEKSDSKSIYSTRCFFLLNVLLQIKKKTNKRFFFHFYKDSTRDFIWTEKKLLFAYIRCYWIVNVNGYRRVIATIWVFLFYDSFSLHFFFIKYTMAANQFHLKLIWTSLNNSKQKMMFPLHLHSLVEFLYFLLKMY